MDTLQNFYPVYVPDQVLTNKSLNHAFGYLNQQNRFTRSGMIGHGIICGLDYTIINRALTESVDGITITINAGHGSTIDGLLIQFPGSTFVAVKRYHLPAVVSNEQLLNPDTVSPVFEKNSNPVKTPDKKKGTAKDSKKEIEDLLYSAYEFIPAGAENASDETIIPLSNFFEEIEGVLFLYLEITDIKSENCSPEDCDDKGKIRTMRVVPLIADRHFFAVQNYVGPQGYTLQTFGLKDYESQNSASALYSEYARINSINAGHVVARLAIILQYDTNNYRISNMQEYEKRLLSQLNSTLLDIKDGRVQYIYDFLHDISLAISEYAQYHNCQRLTACNFASYRHPQILALGDQYSFNSYSDIFRYNFVEATSVQEYNQHKIIGFRLYKRLWDMLAAHFAWLSSVVLPQPRIGISPSRSAPSALGSRAVPCYYSFNNRETFVDSWSAHTCANSIKWDIYGYEFGNGVLDHKLDEYDFFRIEGHIGQEVNEAEKRVNDLINEKNLPFRTFRLMIKRDIIDQQGPTDEVPVKKLAASSAKLRKSAGIDAASAKATFTGEQFAQIPFVDINRYMQDFIGIGLDGAPVNGGIVGGPVYTPAHFRINYETVKTNPNILTIKDQFINNQREIILQVVGTNYGNGLGNEVSPGEIYSLHIVYGKNYLYPSDIAIGKVEKIVIEKTDIPDELIQPQLYTPYSFPPVTVIAGTGDTPESIAKKLVSKILALVQSSPAVNPMPSDIIYSVRSIGDQIYISLNNPPTRAYLYYISTSVKAINSGLIHYLSVEYIGGGALLSPVEITICLRRTDADIKTASKVRMLTGASLVDFPRDTNAYLTLPQVYEICSVSPLVIDTGGGGEVDSEYNIWPFDAKGNLLFNIFKGAEHLGGVYRGGTFIFLTEMQGDKGTEYETVVGDISLPWDLEFVKLSRAVSLKFNRKYWKWANAWETFPPVFTK